MSDNKEAMIKAKAALDSLQVTDGWRLVSAYGNDLIDLYLQQAESIKTGEEAMRLLGSILAIKKLISWPKAQSSVFTQLINQQEKEQ